MVNDAWSATLAAPVVLTLKRTMFGCPAPSTRLVLISVANPCPSASPAPLPSHPGVPRSAFSHATGVVRAAQPVPCASAGCCPELRPAKTTVRSTAATRRNVHRLAAGPTGGIVFIRRQSSAGSRISAAPASAGTSGALADRVKTRSATTAPAGADYGLSKEWTVRGKLDGGNDGQFCGVIQTIVTATTAKSALGQTSAAPQLEFCLGLDFQWTTSRLSDTDASQSDALLGSTTHWTFKRRASCSRPSSFAWVVTIAFMPGRNARPTTATCRPLNGPNRSSVITRSGRRVLSRCLASANVAAPRAI